MYIPDFETYIPNFAIYIPNFEIKTFCKGTKKIPGEKISLNAKHSGIILCRILKELRFPIELSLSAVFDALSFSPPDSPRW